MPKVIILKSPLVRGDKVMSYYDWQNMRREEGICELLDFDRFMGEFVSDKNGTFMGERWRVRFGDGFVTHRFFRTRGYKKLVTVKKKKR